MRIRIRVLLALAALLLLPAQLGWAAESSVSLNTDEAEAVLSILEKSAAGDAVGEADWRRLFESKPYVRLKKRVCCPSKGPETGWDLR